MTANAQRSLLFGSAAVLLFAVQGISAGTDSLLQNPGFEQNLESWATTGTASAIIRSGWHCHEGKWSFGMGNDAGPDDAFGEISQRVTLSEPFTEIMVCRFTIWVMAEENFTGRLVIRQEFLDAAGHRLEENQRSFSGLPRWEWEKQVLWARMPLGTAGIRITCRSEGMESGTGASCVWLDDGLLVIE